MDDFIQLNNRKDILKIVLKDENGNVVKKEGQDVYLEFDMADIELPLKLNKCESEHRKNASYVKMQFIIIDKKQDKKGKYLLSSNEEEKCNVLSEFYRREINTLDLFLGKGGTEKLLNGRNPYWNMYDDINEMLEPILPKLKESVNNVANKVKNKYKNTQEDKVLE